MEDMKISKKATSTQDLIVWQKGHQLTLDIFSTVNDVDPVLFEFMKESALQIISKIAEGNSKFELSNKLNDLEEAKGATARLSTQIILSGELQYITKEKSELLYAQTLEVMKMIKGLIRYIEKSNIQN
jgi:four helix bundle protein